MVIHLWLTVQYLISIMCNLIHLTQWSHRQDRQTFLGTCINKSLGHSNKYLLDFLVEGELKGISMSTSVRTDAQPHHH